MSEDLIARLRERNVLVEDKQVGTLIGLDGVESPIMSGSVTTLYNRDGDEAATRISKLTEALEAALDGLKRASRQLTDDHKIVLGGKQWGGLLIAQAEAALSETNKGGAGE